MEDCLFEALKHYREFLAKERLFLIESAQRIYRIRHGRDPETLRELVDEKLLEPEMIVDPLTGERFLRMEGGAFKAYSVGRDLEDDGGTERMEKDGDVWLE